MIFGKAITKYTMPFFALSVFISVNAFSARAYAEQEGSFAVYQAFEKMRNERMEKSAALYRDMVDQILTGDIEKLDFQTLRRVYSKSTYYVADPDKIINRLYKLAATITDEKASSQDRDNAIQEYNILLSQHLADIDVVQTAYGLSQSDIRLGRREILGQVMDGLRRSIVSVGRGTSFIDAYYVITAGEEVVLLQELGVKPYETEPVQAGAKTFLDINRVRDEETGETRDIYVNISVPMRELYREHNKFKAMRNPASQLY